MKLLQGILLLGAVFAARGEPDRARSASTHSHSGQFVTYGVPADARRTTPVRDLTNASMVVLGPALTAMSCERLKLALLRELNASDQWKGKFFVLLRPARTRDDTLQVTSARYADGWRYTLEVPDVVGKARFQQAVLQTLMLEMANRGGGERPAELPAWLREGLPAHITANASGELVVEPPRFRVHNVAITPDVRDGRRADPLGPAKEVLRQRPPCTFEELSWPVAEALSDERGDVFRSSAQVFIHELTRLEGGREALQEFILSLPQSLNWQTEFLRAFRAYFADQTALEKWWALQSAHFTGRELSQIWPLELSWQKFDEALRPEIQVRLATNDLPLQAGARLQTILSEWTLPRQVPVLQKTTRQLQALQIRVAPELVPLVNDYRVLLESYFRDLERVGARMSPRQIAPQLSLRLVRETVQRLDRLDLQRDILRPPRPAPGSKSQAPGPLPAPVLAR